MRIPHSFTVPQFVLEHVLVAPDEWPTVSDPEAAKRRLADLKVCLQNPDILYVISRVFFVLATAEGDVDDHKFAGVHDVFNQQQLIGEKRGLKMLFRELAEIHETLVEVATSVTNT